MPIDETIIASLDFQKGDGLVPAIVQHVHAKLVLMLGFMNEEALRHTVETGKVTFYSRTKGRLWTKGETSDNFLYVRDIKVDCDRDTLLIAAEPAGPVCHLGQKTCFGDEVTGLSFIHHLDQVIRQRRDEPNDQSYTSSLFQAGIDKVAQKVGEEAVELILEAKNDDADRFHNEAADLLYHYLVLLRAKDTSIESVLEVLIDRHR